MLEFALTIKRCVMLHMRFCKTSRHAWDVLKTMFQSNNNARIYFCSKDLNNMKICEGIREHHFFQPLYFANVAWGL